MNVELLAEQHLKCLSLTGGCSGSSESTLVKIPHCWKSHVVAELYASLQKVKNHSSSCQKTIRIHDECEGEIEKSAFQVSVLFLLGFETNVGINIY